MFAAMQMGRMGLVSSDVGGPFSPSQRGPTLDLVFVGGAITDPLAAVTTSDQSINLNFATQTYQVAAQYAIWE
jgi:hypothetical protein